MKTSLSPILNFTLQHEGGYSACRADPGNWTGGRVGSGQLVGSKFGLSAPIVVRDRGLCVTAQTMKLLSKADFQQVALNQFWFPLRCGVLPAGIDALVFDHAFNAGAKTSARLLQQIVGADPDGVIGAKTIQAIDAVRLTEAGRFCAATYIKALQGKLGVQATGLMDATTLSEIERQGRRIDLLCYALSSQQMADYRSKRGFNIFGAGWLERARDRLQFALSLIGKTPPQS